MAKRRRKQKQKHKRQESPAAPAAVERVLDPRPAWFRRMAEDLSGTGTALYLILVLTVVVFTYSIFVPFVFDDAPVVTRNQDLWTWNPVQLIKLNVNRCLVNFTFYFNFTLANTPTTRPYEPAVQFTWSYHAVSIVLHALNGILVFLLVRGLLLARSEVRPGLEHWVAMAAAALWLVHPVHVMAVSYIAQRYALMGANAFLGACVCYLYARLRASRGEPRPAWGLWVGATLCVIACAITKENSIVIPGALLAIELFFFKGKRWWAPLALTTPFLIGGLIMLNQYGFDKLSALWFPAQSRAGATRVQYFTSQIYVTLRYLNQFLLPIDQTVEHGFPHASGPLWPHKTADVLFALVGHLLIWVLTLKLFVRGLRLIPLAIGWYYLCHIVESSFLPILDLMVDHRLYLPSALLPAAFVVGCARYYPALEKAEPRTRVLMPLGIVALVTVLSVGTVARIHTWTSPTGIWIDTLEKRPTCARAYSSLGMEHLYQEEWLKAVGPIETSLELGAVHVEGWNNLGNAYLNLKDWTSAEYALLNGIRINQISPSKSVRFCWNNVGLVYRNMAFKDDPQLDEAANKARRKKLLELASYRFDGAIKVGLSVNKKYAVAWMNLIDAESALRELAESPEERAKHANKVIEALGSFIQLSKLQKMAPAYQSLVHGMEAFLDLKRPAQGLELIEKLGFPYQSPAVIPLRQRYARAALAAYFTDPANTRELLARAHTVLAAEYKKFTELAQSDERVSPLAGSRVLLLRILIAEALNETAAVQALTQQAVQLNPKLGPELDGLRTTLGFKK